MRNGGESRITARVVSRGAAIGQAVCLHGQKRQFYRIELATEQIAAESERLDFAVKAATQQLSNLASARNSELPDTLADIFDVHLLILKDSSLVANIARSIIDEKVNAEWAIKLVSEDYLNRYRAISDEHLREKSVDLEDVTERILNALSGDESFTKLPKNAIIFASEIRPSTLMEFFHNRPQAMVTEHGGWTSHAFIMAREMGIPALAGVQNVLRRIKTGDPIAVDAFEGKLIIRPTDETKTKLLSKGEQSDISNLSESKSVGTVKTRDNREMRIAANVDQPELCEQAVEMGTNGIGLLRSEYLFDCLHGLPDEETQFAAFQQVARIAGKNGIRIRTFDLGVDQIANATGEREKNPALGLKAIRLSLSIEKNFRIQLRSILRASHDANVQIVLPLISGVDEIRRTKKIIEDEYKLLTVNNILCGKPQVGAMIETPSAVLSISEILRHVDFICLGTNDLVQYLIAVDRDNESVADFYQTLHPAVIRSIKIVLDSAKAANIPATMCGEMAGSPFYTPLLIGLGAIDFSMNLHSIAGVHKLISGISYTETLELVKTIESAETASEIEDLLVIYYQTHWSHLFPTELMWENAVKQYKNISKN